MEFWHLLLLVVAVTGPSSVQGEEWGQEHVDEILKIHNDRRREENGCYMNAFKYDTELESQARAWANKCEFKHDSVQGRGENLAKIISKKSYIAILQQSANMWWRERQNYQYGQDTCGGSCHYTQMVWADTLHIGCYIAACDNWLFVVCFYSPCGNWRGQQPFEKQCDSRCREGQKEDNGLCYAADKVDQKQNSSDSNKNNENTKQDNGKDTKSDSKTDSSKDTKSDSKTDSSKDTKSDNKTDSSKDTKDDSKTDSSKDTKSDNKTDSSQDTKDDSKTDSSKDTKSDKTDSTKDTKSDKTDSSKDTKSDSKTDSDKDTNKNNESSDNSNIEGKKDSQSDNTSNDNKDSSNNAQGSKPKSDCEDLNEYCDYWEGRGHCQRTPLYMSKNCRKACGLC